ncbi:integral membrane sensor signal transduction histidine kinase [Alcanivorax sp. S71-1-4]|uniref:ATP-binding protein n=1 Tax=Alcanivorax sp. S71-1-4 TaxID=1177159 RepID=UPI001359B13D|nr:ATP-binding protein [Alcanivorax sp. S71-1-4]KAF0805632.1 integral membrane sensor signal transduction histidine kinase [Alcanivorax sp. S71-1-4]
MTRLFLSLFAGISAALVLLYFALEAFTTHWYADLANEVAVGQARGVSNVLEVFLRDYPAQEAGQIMERAFGDSDIPVTMERYEAAQVPLLAPGQMNALNPDEFLLHYRTLDGQWRMILGPVYLPPEVAVAEGVALTLVFGCLGVVCLLWIWWLHRKIRGLEQNTLAFASGNLDIRAPTGMRWRLGSLNDHFNTMASRISRLIFSHKSLTNAVAHELRTPIFRMRFRLDTLENDSSPPVRDEALAGARDDLDELENLVEELLDHARLERLESSLPLTEVDLRRWLTQLFPRLKHHSPVPLALRVEYRDACQVNIDARLLARALDNLVRNAQTYARQCIVLTLDSDGEHGLLHVDDDGLGVPLAERERIFEPFVRLDQSRTRATGGHGLGLSIVREAIRLMGGQIRVGDSPQGGARFTLVLPMRQRTP